MQRKEQRLFAQVAPSMTLVTWTTGHTGTTGVGGRSLGLMTTVLMF